MTDREKAYFAQICREVLEPMIVDLGVSIIDEIERSNLRLVEMMGKVLTEHTGSVLDEFMAAEKQKRERIEIDRRTSAERERQAEELRQKNRRRPGFHKNA